MTRSVIFELTHAPCEERQAAPCAAIEHTHTILDLIVGVPGTENTCGDPAPHTLVIDGEEYAACCVHYVEFIESQRVN